MDTDEHGLRRFTPYTVEMVIHNQKPPACQYVHVYINNVAYVIELHKEHPPTSTSSLGFYGQHWIITKKRGNEAVTEA